MKEHRCSYTFNSLLNKLVLREWIHFRITGKLPEKAVIYCMHLKYHITVPVTICLC